MRPSHLVSVRGGRREQVPIGVRVAALGALAALGLAGCGDGPAAPNYGYTAPEDVLGEDSRAFEENRKELAAAGGLDPRELAERIGCTAYSPVFADRVGEILGSCRLQGRQLRLFSFADQEAQQAYLDTHRDQSLYVVGDVWAVRVPSRALAELVRQRIGGRVA